METSNPSFVFLDTKIHRIMGEFFVDLFEENNQTHYFQEQIYAICPEGRMLSNEETKSIGVAISKLWKPTAV